MDTKYEITCEATATIGERWRFDLPADWETLADDEKEDAISDAASAGECLSDWVIGNEETREWDLDTLQAADAGGMSTSDGLGGAASVEQKAVQACTNLAEYLNSQESWNGGDVCEVLAQELRNAGHTID